MDGGTHTFTALACLVDPGRNLGIADLAEPSEILVSFRTVIQNYVLTAVSISAFWHWNRSDFRAVTANHHVVNLPETAPIAISTCHFIRTEVIPVIGPVIHMSTVSTPEYKRIDFGNDSVGFFNGPEFRFWWQESLGGTTPVVNLRSDAINEVLVINLICYILPFNIHNLLNGIILWVVEGLARHKLEQNLRETAFHWLSPPDLSARFSTIRPSSRVG